MKSFLKEIYRSILRKMPTRLALYIIYFKGYKKILNLKNPRFFGEKIQWLKLYGGLEKLGDYVDKYEVRKYVEETIGEGYLFDIIGVFDTVEEINFQSLPNSFVIKCTNGSQSVLICKNKSEFDFVAAKKIMKKWLSDEFYKMKKEPQYKYVKNRILIEQYMEDESGELRDYKFYCFDGKPYWYGVFSGRFSDKTVDTYSIDEGFLPDCKNGGSHVKTSKNPTKEIPNVKEFVELACKLSKPFTFVRVDFYMVNGKIYFGELTFTDGAGSEPILPYEKYDLAFARKIPLKNVLK